ncbi:MAG TPA: efflux RND transporter permease subunit [Candidatus Methylacidiphilales bacterium]|jgi:HAE1 family hydrophobic/amphiphilic exporter-1|nr:efflux RND transporter permease subunit [Candidatus Methylacidiphilales bacterium]
MASFFINRPIVAIVIAIVTVILGLVAMLELPIAQFPNIVPPEVQVKSTYTGADALTVEQSVATPIEQQMSGVDNMNYMYSVNANSGQSCLTVNFDIKTDPNIDQILAQMRSSQAASQLPSQVNNYGVTVQKSTSAPMMLFALYSPGGTYDNIFLANYAYINLNDALTRVPGIASVTIFGAGQYAMRLWVNPDVLARRNITVPEIISAVQKQNTVNPAGQIGAEPVPPGQEFTYAVRAQGRLSTEADFGNIIVRANSDGSVVRVSDVARVELGAQTYNMIGRFKGKPAAILALYQLPGTNALDAANGAKKLMNDLRKRFPPDMECDIALDTTLAVSAGMKDIEHTLFEALILVVLVVYIFLQGWRATLIPLLAVPVSLIGTFAFFPMFGFSINTLSLFGLVLAIGLVVDDAIVVVEAVEHHIEKGLSPKDAALKAMHEVSGPVVAIALILSAVFVPTIFIPGITGRLYQQFAVTIAISVLISAFNALTLSPALCAMLLRPRTESRGPLGMFFRWFNRVFGAATTAYVSVCSLLIRRMSIAAFIVIVAVVGIWWSNKHLAPGFVNQEDQGYAYAVIMLPPAASLQRTDEVCKKVEDMVDKVPGVASCTTIVGYNLISAVQNTYSGFFFITLKPWDERYTLDNLKTENAIAVFTHLNERIRSLPECTGFAFPPPPIPGIGTAGGVTMVLQDRAGKDVQFLEDNMEKFIAAAKKRPEIAMVQSPFNADIPQRYVNVDKDRVLKQGVELSSVYQTIQTFMGGAFINYFNRFGRQWQVYVQAEGAFRTQGKDLAQFYVRNNSGEAVSLGALTSIRDTSGPEFTQRFNLYRSAQINAFAKGGYSDAQVMKALEEVFHETMPPEMGFSYMGMSFQEQQAAQGVPPAAIFALSLLFVFLILAALYESWSLPFSVLLSLPVAVLGAFLALWARALENNAYAQIGLIMLIGLAAKNAILIVEFSRAEHMKGKPLLEASLEGARLRLRPILMTSFAFILGCVPLLIALGAGMVSRHILGTTVVGGMVFSSFIAIFLVPVSFYAMEKLTGNKPAEPAAPGEPAESAEATEQPSPSE